MNEFGKRLKKLRLDAGITQQQLADRLWLSKGMVSYYEQSLRAPSPEVLIKLAAIFHVTTDYLLGIESKKQTLDITDLPDEDIALLEDFIAALRRKNDRINRIEQPQQLQKKRKAARAKER